MSCLSPKNFPLLTIVVLGLFLCGVFSEPADAKRKRKRAPSPVKILDVGTSPEPFVIGKSPLKISMTVQLPRSLRDTNVLEVSALITSPTRRSMSFVSHRLELNDPLTTQSFGTFPVELVWDGKDQHDRWVPDGSYFYEIQAKLMRDKGDGPRTRVVSRRIHGTLEALAYEGEILPPVPPETEVTEESEATPSGEEAGEEPQIVEEGLKVTDESVDPDEEVNGEPQAGSEETLQQTMNIEKNANSEEGDVPAETNDPGGLPESQTDSITSSTPVPSGR